MDVECEFGYEYVNAECHAITGLDTAQCGAVREGSYHASASKHRLIQGDACAGIARVITDTDGKGGLPGGRSGGAHGARKHWATAFVAFLVTVPPLSLGSAHLGIMIWVATPDWVPRWRGHLLGKCSVASCSGLPTIMVGITGRLMHHATGSCAVK